MKSALICVFVFLLFTISLFIREPKISGRVDLLDSVVGIKMDGSKVMPVFSQDYNPEAFSIKIGNISFPLTVGPYESFLSILIWFPFSFSIYSMLFFNIIVGIFLIILSSYFSRSLLTSLLVTISLISLSPLIDRNSYYIGSVFVLIGLMMIIKEDDTFPIILLITSLISLKLGISLFLSFLVYSFANRETKSKIYATIFFIAGLLPSAISVLYSVYAYSRSHYLVAPPNLHLIKVGLGDMAYYLLLLIPILAYLENKERTIHPFLFFMIFHFIAEFIFYSQEEFKFLPSFIVSSLLFGNQKKRIRIILLVILFLSVQIYNAFKDRKNYYPLNSVKELSEYFEENNIRNPSLFCDVPLSSVSGEKIRPTRWYHLWDFLKEKEKYKDKDLRDMQALALKMQKNKYIVICTDKDDYDEVNIIRIKHHINMRRIKDFPQDKPVFIVAHVE